MAYKGKMVWISADILEHIDDLVREQDITVSEALRQKLDLPIFIPINAPRMKSSKPRYRSYNVTDLKVGETKLFGFHKNGYALWRSVRKYAAETGKSFTRTVTANGLQVKRIE